MVLDVGAGTVDVAIFNVYKHDQEDQDRYPIFASAVKPLGTHYLMDNRLQHLGYEGRQWDDLQAIPEAANFAHQFGVDENRVSQIDEQFACKVTETIGAALCSTKARRDQLARAWDDGVPVFLVGGGASCQVYEDSLHKACGSFKTPYLSMSLPAVADLGEGISSSVAHRLAVAFGLTYDAESIGRILAQHEVEDIPFTDRPIRERPDRDELYAK